MGLVSVTSKRPRSTWARHAAVLGAIAALLGQAIFPHVHAVPPADSPTMAAYAPATVFCGDPCPTALAAAALPSPGGDTDRHAPANCPLCRAQNDARSSVLPLSVALPAPALGASAPVPAPAAVLVAVARDVAAPRGPPVAS